MADYYSDELLRNQKRGLTKTINIPQSTNNFFPVQYPLSSLYLCVDQNKALVNDNLGMQGLGSQLQTWK